MKKILMLSAILLVIQFMGTANCQPLVSTSPLMSIWYEDLDTAFTNISSPNTAVAFNSRALKMVNRSYRNISEVNWYQLESGYLVKFMKDNIPTKVFFNSKGILIGTIRKMTEKQVPKDIQGMIKADFSDYKINLFQEVTVGSHLVYIAYLENEEGFKIVRICDDEMDIMKDFKK